ncbi:MAG: hypothetical protein ABIF77_08760 [bacterium]
MSTITAEPREDVGEAKKVQQDTTAQTPRKKVPKGVLVAMPREVPVSALEAAQKAAATISVPDSPPDIQQRAKQLVAFGMPIDEVSSQLVKEGFSAAPAQDAAKQAFRQATDDRVQSSDESLKPDHEGDGRAKMMAGTLLCTGGLMASMISYGQAGPNGIFYAFCGLVLGGVALLVLGLFDARN